MILDQFGVSFNNPIFISNSVSSSIVNAGHKGMILTLRKNSIGDNLKCFNCGYLGYFGYESTQLICGGYRKLMIYSLRTINDKINYERFIRPLTFLDHFFNEMALFFIEPKESDYKMLEVMINEPQRCPKYINSLFQQFVDRKKMIKCNMRILMKYYKKLLGKTFVTKECEEVLSISFICEVFKNCELLEIEMEADQNGDCQPLTQLYLDTLFSEIDFINKDLDVVKLKEIRIHQIQIEKTQIEALNEKLKTDKWQCQSIVAQNKENQNYLGTSLSIQKA